MIRLKVVTNRKLCKNNLYETIKNLLEELSISDKFNIDSIVLREKDLDEEEYMNLYKDIKSISKDYGISVFAHNNLNSQIISDGYLHLSMDNFLEMVSSLKKEDSLDDFFNEVGVSIHSKDEAILAAELGATYLIFGHIFETDCKKGFKPRGLSQLKEICKSVNIPVFAIGGINEENALEVISNDAYGVCMMSNLMRY